MAEADIIILSQSAGEDPRPQFPRDKKSKPRRETTVRVVLHRGTKRVLVEVEDGRDAVNAQRWRRIDSTRRRDEVRGAYDALERVTADYYERTVGAEGRVVAAEKRALEAERRLAAPRSPVLPLSADPKAEAKKLFAKLSELANTESTSIDERRNAALAAIEILSKNRLSIA
jgi:hypothetical protein